MMVPQRLIRHIALSLLVLGGSLAFTTSGTNFPMRYSCLWEAKEELVREIDQVSCKRRRFLTLSTTIMVGSGLAGVTIRPADAAPEANVSTPLVTTTAFQESLSGFVAGAALTATKTIVKYPLDTATVRLQMPQTQFSAKRPIQLFEGSFRGILSPLLFNIPGGAIFFAAKDATRTYLRQQLLAPKWASTCLSVICANFPYWVVRNPSEVIKTKQQANLEVDEYSNLTVSEAFHRLQSEQGLQGFYVGYCSNIAYANPADIFKFLVYEAITSASGKPTTALDGAIVGAFSTAFAQFVTTPLDVVRNRVMTTTPAKDENARAKPVRLDEVARSEGWSGLFAGSAPRIGKALLSGAIQFATYEETKTQMLELLTKTTMR